MKQKRNCMYAVFVRIVTEDEFYKAYANYRTASAVMFAIRNFNPSYKIMVKEVTRAEAKLLQTMKYKGENK